MLKRTLIFLGITSLVAGTAYYLWKEYKLVSDWKISVVKLQVTGYTTEQLSLKVSLKVVNPSNVEAVVDHLNSSIYIDDAYVGSISQTNVMPIPAHGYNILDLNATIDNAEFLNQLLNFTSTGNPIRLHTVGTLRVSSGFVKVRVPINDTSTYTLSDLLS